MTDTRSEQPRILVNFRCISCGTQTNRTFHDEAEAAVFRKRKVRQCKSCQQYAAEEV